MTTPTAIKRHRKRLGWTQEQLARHLGISRSAVASWEQGVRFPCCRWMKLELRRIEGLRKAPKGGA